MESPEVERQELIEAVSRKVSRARVRLSLETARALAGEHEMPRDHDGNVITDPSDDEQIPLVSRDTLPFKTCFPELDPT